MSDLNEVLYSRIRRYKRPSLWRRFLWWLGPHFTICNLVLFAFCFYMVWQIGAWARSGMLPAGW
jgi:hypothetical protein